MVFECIIICLLIYLIFRQERRWEQRGLNKLSHWYPGITIAYTQSDPCRHYNRKHWKLLQTNLFYKQINNFIDSFETLYTEVQVDLTLYINTFANYFYIKEIVFFTLLYRQNGRMPEYWSDSVEHENGK